MGATMGPKQSALGQTALFLTFKSPANSNLWGFLLATQILRRKRYETPSRSSLLGTAGGAKAQGNGKPEAWLALKVRSQWPSGMLIGPKNMAIHSTEGSGPWLGASPSWQAWAVVPPAG